MTYFRDNIENAHGYVPGFQPREAEVVKLNTNENPWPPSPKVMEALKRIGAEKLRRYPQPLGDTFRSAAAEVLGVPAEHILCSNGGDDLLTMCFRAFCDPDRPVAYPVPTYTLYRTLAQLQDCPVIEIPYDDPEWLDNLATCKARLIIVCNPNAPTSTRADCEQLARLAGQIQGVLLIDEAYVDFADGNCLELTHDFQNVIVLRSMSKGYGLAGLRFGFGIAQPSLIEGLLKVKDSYNVDAVAIELAAAAIRDQEYLASNVTRLRKERTRLTEALREMDFEVADSQTNFLLARSPQRDAEAVYKQLAKRHVYVRYFDEPGLQDKLRITVGTPEQNLALISALQEILTQ